MGHRKVERKSTLNTTLEIHKTQKKEIKEETFYCSGLRMGSTLWGHYTMATAQHH